MQGKIIKGIAGFYYIYAEDGNVYECKAKGIFRKDNFKPLVGDNVEITVLNEEEKEGSGNGSGTGNGSGDGTGIGSGNSAGTTMAASTSPKTGDSSHKELFQVLILLSFLFSAVAARRMFGGNAHR